MTTWTPKTKQVETWTSESESTRVFSQHVFSHAFYTGKRVFSMGKSGGIWDNSIQQAETWTPE